MRHAVLVVAAFVSFPASAQVIDSKGITANGVRIDAAGIHAGDAGVTRRGVRSGERGGGTIDGNDAVHNINCRGGSLTVNGNRNAITTTECSSVTLSGNRNRLRWHRNQGRTAVSNLGNGNTVSHF